MINLSYDQKQNLNVQLQKTGKNVLEQSIIVGSSIFVTIIRFIWSGFKQVIGK